MMGLVIKDFLCIKSKIKSFVLLIAFFLIWGFVFSNHDILYTVLGVFPYLLMATTFSSDETSKYNTFALTTPVSRRDIVVAKYVILMLFFSISCLFFLVFLIFQTDPQPVLWSGGSIFAVIFCLLCIMIPVWFQYGVEKSRLVVFVGFLSFLILPYFSQMFGLVIDIEAYVAMLPYLGMIVLPLVLFLSFFCSYKIVQKKEY